MISISHKRLSHYVDKRCSAVHRGVSHDGRFVGGGERDQERDGNTSTKTQDLDRFVHQYDVIPISCVLMYCIEISSRGPLPLLIYSRGVGLQGK